MNADKPANGGGKPSLNAVIRAIRDWFAGVLHVLAHKVWPAVRSFTTRMASLALLDTSFRWDLK